MEIILPKGLTCRTASQIFQHNLYYEIRSETPVKHRQKENTSAAAQGHGGADDYYYSTQQVLRKQDRWSKAFGRDY